MGSVMVLHSKTVLQPCGKCSSSGNETKGLLIDGILRHNCGLLVNHMCFQGACESALCTPHSTYRKLRSPQSISAASWVLIMVVEVSFSSCWHQNEVALSNFAFSWWVSSFTTLIIIIMLFVIWCTVSERETNSFPSVKWKIRFHLHWLGNIFASMCINNIHATITNDLLILIVWM